MDLIDPNLLELKKYLDNTLIRKKRIQEELLVRALSLPGVRRSDTQVYDLTFGFGRDSLLARMADFQVTAFDRNNKNINNFNELIKISADELGAYFQSGFKLTLANSALVLERRQVEPLTPAPDVLYLDPMFPDRDRKTALPSKAFQILQQEIQESPDEDRNLLSQALKTPCRRIVVKRPLKAPDLLPGKTGSIKGRTVRFDLYPPTLR